MIIRISYASATAEFRGMRHRHLLLGLLAASAAAPLWGSEAEDNFVFASIDGGELRLAEFRGGPVLVVNTASRCMSTPQYDGLQALWERYRDRGLRWSGCRRTASGRSSRRRRRSRSSAR